MKILSIAEVRRQLKPGVVFLAVPLASHLKQFGLITELRLVVRNTPTEIESKVLSGPRVNSSLFQTWKGIHIVQNDDGSIDLSTCQDSDPFVQYVPQVEKEQSDGPPTVYQGCRVPDGTR